MLMISTIGLYARAMLPENGLTETKKSLYFRGKVIKI